MATTATPGGDTRAGPLATRVAPVTGGTAGIGDATRILADDESANVTGQIWAVHGGLDM
jgi:hypothetical protein